MNFLPSYRGLHDAGYNVLAYDMRNHGMSGSGNGGICTVGLTEYTDAMGFDGGYDRLDRACYERTGLHLEEQSPLTYASSITVPTLVAQVHDDLMTRPEDVQAIYDAILVTDKKMDWIGGTDRRFDGYNYFSEHPEVAAAWFDDHVR